MKRCDVAVIVVNYGTAKLALEAVASVLSANHGPLKVSVDLVDNASPGDDAEVLAQAIANRGWADRVTLHAEPTNHGFGRGNNLVLSRLLDQPDPPAMAFLLNPDARLENDAILRLWDHLQAHPDAGAAGARIEDGEGQPVTAAFRFPNMASVFASAAAFGPVSRMFAQHEVALAPDLATQPVDWVAGAAVMLRLSALRQSGLFDPGYFLYFEEVDLMRKLARHGWQTWFVAEARVSHSEGAATGVRSGDTQRKRRPAYWYQSWRLYFQRNHGRGYAVLAALAWAAGTGINIVTSSLRGRRSSAPLGFFRDLWVHVLVPLLVGGRAVSNRLAAEDAAKDATSSCLGCHNANPAGLSFAALVAEDFRAHGRDPLSQGFWALFWHRFGNWRMGVRPCLLRPPLTLIYLVMARVTQWLCGIDLPYTVKVGRRVILEHFGGMILTAEAIGDDVTIRQNTTFGIASVLDRNARPKIGNRVDIGAGAVILGGVSIGDDAVIGANAVVVRDVPAMTVVGGVPARVLRNRCADEVARAQRLRGVT